MGAISVHNNEWLKFECFFCLKDAWNFNDDHHLVTLTVFVFFQWNTKVDGNDCQARYSVNNDLTNLNFVIIYCASCRYK